MSTQVIQKKAIIIGAGPSGLTALKEMLAEGLDAEILEEHQTCGGVFRKENKKTYENLFLTTSNIHSSFSDFPPKDSTIKYSTKEEYTQYIEDYVEHFDLEKFIRYNCQVIEASLNETKQWNIKTLDKQSGEEVFYQSDSLVVATGSQQIPNTPDLSGYTGQILHSSEYTGPDQFKGKSVLILGIGESSSDVASEISEVAEQTVVYSRRPFLIAPRFPMLTMTEKNYDEGPLLQKSHDKFPHVSDYLEFFTIGRLANLLPIIPYTMIRMIFLKVWATGITGKIPKTLSAWNGLVAKKYSFWKFDQNMVATKNSRLASMTNKEKLTVIVAEKLELNHKTVRFHGEFIPNEHVEDFDIIVSCTGYKTQFKWLKEPLEIRPRTWFKHCFPPQYGEKLFFLGWARPHQGGIPACAEMLARYGALLVSGRRYLPSDFAERAEREGAVETNFYEGSPSVNSLVDYPSFMDSIAKEIGCKPKSPSIFKHPSLWLIYWIYPNWSVWYRMRGPHANPEVLTKFLNIVPLGKSFKLDGVLFVGLHVLFLISFLPFVLLKKAFSALSTKKREILHFGWMLSLPKIEILHGNGKR